MEDPDRPGDHACPHTLVTSIPDGIHKHKHTHNVNRGSVRLTVGSTGVYWLFPAASKRPGKVMANAFSAGFHRFIHRFLAVPVGSRERATR